MHRYRLGHQLGEGAFGKVVKATHKETGEEVAIKTLKDKCNDFDTMMALPEVKALRTISHENIVQCKELVLDSKGKVHMIFELLKEGNLETINRKRHQPFTESQIRSIFYQLLCALAHMHSMSYIHRDIKPENILLQSYSLYGEIKIKLADLGLAKRLGPTNRPNTTYVATRWYRSPEILLRIATYGFPSDLWALGAVMAELVCLGDPLFPGDNEKDQLVRVIALRGHPAMVGWERGDSAMKTRRVRLPKTTPSSLRSAVPHASLPVLQLISDLLEMDPARRPTAVQALGYPLFVVHPENVGSMRARKKRKIGSGNEVEVDTARTRDCPSSTWSRGSEGERDEERVTGELQPYTLGNRATMGAGVGKIPSMAGTARDGEFAGEQEKMFNIPQFNKNPTPESGQVKGTGLRRPAGHFDLRE